MSVIAITYPLALPAAPAPARTRFRLEYAIGRARSPFSRRGQRHDWGGRQWFAEVTLPPMLRATADAWIVWAAKLHGGYGHFRLGDWDRRTSRGNPAGTPLVNGASQTGNGLAVDGFGAGATLKEGDHVELENYLYLVAADFAADGAGAGTIQLEPDLRSSPADDAALTVASPKGLFELVENSLPWDADAMAVHGITFAAQEYLA